jgi:hypothetical protein
VLRIAFLVLSMGDGIVAGLRRWTGWIHWIAARREAGVDSTEIYSTI